MGIKSHKIFCMIFVNNLEMSNCRWKEVKFLAFYYFNILDSDDEVAQVSNLGDKIVLIFDTF